MELKINLAELKYIRLLSSNFEIEDTENTLRGGSLEFACEVQIIEGDSEDRIHLLSKLKVNGYNNKNLLFTLQSRYVSEFLISDQKRFSSLPEEEKIQYCLSLVYSILREDAMACFSRAGLRQIMLPYHFNKQTFNKQNLSNNRH